MVERDTLLTIAELSVSLIGVSGIVAVFLSRKPIKALDSARFLVIVATGSLVAFLSFVPIWLHKHLGDTPQVWSTAAAIALGAAVITNLIVGYFTRTSLRQVTESFAGETRTSRFGAAALTLTVLSLLLVNIIGWPVEPNGTIYELTLFVGIIQMAIAFASLVLAKESADQKTP